MHSALGVGPFGVSAGAAGVGVRPRDLREVPNGPREVLQDEVSRRPCVGVFDVDLDPLTSMLATFG